MPATKIAFETDIFLSDFFYRNPEFLRPPASLEEEEAVTNKLRLVQDSLDYLANLDHVSIYTSVPAFCRFAGILTDLKVKPEQIKDELEYVCSNVGLLEVNLSTIEQVMNKHTQPFQFEVWVWENLAKEFGLSGVLTSKSYVSPELLFLAPGKGLEGLI